MKNYTKFDPKSNKPLYFIPKEEFHTIALSSFPIDYGDIPLHAAQHDYIGTVMLTNNDMPVLFQGVGIYDLINKASQEGLIKKDSNPLTSELTVVLDKGGGHFFAILSNQTHHIYGDLYPESYNEEDNNGFSYGLVHVFNSIFSTQTDGCKLEHNGDNGIVIHEGMPGLFSGDHSYIYTEQFNDGVKKPMLGEYSMRFKISNYQYQLAYDAIEDTHNKCLDRQINYSPTPGDNENVENCFTHINKIVQAVGIQTPYLKFFLDFQLLSNDDVAGRYAYNIKHELANPKNFALIMQAVAEIVNAFTKDTDDDCDMFSADPFFITVPCHDQYNNQCHIEESPQNFFGTCLAIIDQGILYKDIFVNAKGNLERITTRSMCEDETCKETICHIEYNIETAGNMPLLLEL
ncbi:MAG: hypothetical protein HRU36_01385 [Rickettsiales bacterium]|nr:hypothetical protein [Rickettsiales bacterium]